MKYLEPSAADSRKRPELFDHFRPTFEASPTPLLLVDNSGEILMSNALLNRLFGYASDELVGQSIDVLVPEQVRGHHPDLREAFLEYPKARQMGTGRDLYGVCNGGHQIPVEIGLTPVEFKGETLVLVSVLDITERKRQEEKFRLAVDAAASAILMLDFEGRIELMNRQAVEMFGYAPDELVGKNVESLIPERFQRKHTVYRASFVRQPTRRPMGRGRDLYAKRKDSSEFPVEIGLTPIDSPDAHFVMATVIDITERKKSEAEIRRKNQQLSRLNEELSQFAYSASHDLKAPLVTIRGLAEVMEEDLRSGEVAEVAEIAGRIKNLAGDLGALVDDILALATSDADDDQLGEVDVADVVRAVFAKSKEQAAEREVELVDAVERGSLLNTQPRRLTQIVENLVSNAIKFSDPAKSGRIVEVGSSRGSDGILLWIRDNGLGIPTQGQPHLFKMFRRFHPKLSGSGLGLALVKKHVQKLGGEIDFESSGEGTEFSIRLPLLDD